MESTEKLGPKNHAEAVAIFRAQVIAPLCVSALSRGDRTELLKELCGKDFMAPGAAAPRQYAVATLERWLYAWRTGGLAGLMPRRRSDRGHAQELNDEQRELLLAIRRENPATNATLILRTLELDGRLEKDAVSASTVRRLYAQHGLDRRSRRQGGGEQARRRWSAAQPDALWHSDVCHGPAMKIAGRVVPLRIHALLDDHSRYVVAIQACATERESEMLALLVKALRRFHAPETLYLDNGATYRGDVLGTACSRLGISLVHAQPHDPQARGKMERFWRTLREGCLDHLGAQASLHDVQVRLLAFVDQHYHLAPHASLMGKSPAQVYEAGRSQEPTELREEHLAAALTVHGRRRVRRDGTVEIAGLTFETTAGFLAGRNVTVGRSLLNVTSDPWIEHEEQRFELRPVDPVANGRRKEPNHRERRGLDVPFDPPGALLDKMLGRTRGES